MNYKDGQEACQKLYGHIVEFDERTNYKPKMIALKNSLGVIHKPRGQSFGF